MNLKKILFEYGEKVPGYDVRVLNEREARAAAGILGTLGLIVIFVGIGFNHIMVARIFLGFFFIDFTARIINPNYAPTMLLGRFFVQNQIPEYVGASQKRFAWAIGWLISLPLLWWFVIHWDITFYKVLLCVLCLFLTFFESAFGICVGCMIYKAITKNDPQHCPGGVCEVRKKDPIQTFNPMQKIITVITMIGLIVGTYSFLSYKKSETFFGVFLYEMVLTDAQLQKEKDEEYQKIVDAEFGNDDEDDDE